MDAAQSCKNIPRHSTKMQLEIKKERLRKEQLNSLEQTNFINEFVEQYKKKPSIVAQSLQNLQPE